MIRKILCKLGFHEDRLLSFPGDSNHLVCRHCAAGWPLTTEELRLMAEARRVSKKAREIFKLKAKMYKDERLIDKEDPNELHKKKFYGEIVLYLSLSHVTSIRSIQSDGFARRVIIEIEGDETLYLVESQGDYLFHYEIGSSKLSNFVFVHANCVVEKAHLEELFDAWGKVELETKPMDYKDYNRDGTRITMKGQEHF